MAVAIGSSPLGLDTEPLGDIIEGLVDRVFSAMLTAPGPSRSDRVPVVWPAVALGDKEAIGKASGVGLIEAERILAPPPGEWWHPASDAFGETGWLSWLALPDAVAAAVAIYHRQDHVWVERHGQQALELAVQVASASPSAKTPGSTSPNSSGVAANLSITTVLPTGIASTPNPGA